MKVISQSLSFVLHSHSSICINLNSQLLSQLKIKNMTPFPRDYCSIENLSIICDNFIFRDKKQYHLIHNYFLYSQKITWSVKFRGFFVFQCEKYSSLIKNSENICKVVMKKCESEEALQKSSSSKKGIIDFKAPKQYSADQLSLLAQNMYTLYLQYCQSCKNVNQEIFLFGEKDEDGDAEICHKKFCQSAKLHLKNVFMSSYMGYLEFHQLMNLYPSSAQICFCLFYKNKNAITRQLVAVVFLMVLEDLDSIREGINEPPKNLEEMRLVSLRLGQEICHNLRNMDEFVFHNDEFKEKFLDLVIKWTQIIIETESGAPSQEIFKKIECKLTAEEMKWWE